MERRFLIHPDKPKYMVLMILILFNDANIIWYLYKIYIISLSFARSSLRFKV